MPASSASKPVTSGRPSAAASSTPSGYTLPEPTSLAHDRLDAMLALETTVRRHVEGGVHPTGVGVVATRGLAALHAEQFDRVVAARLALARVPTWALAHDPLLQHELDTCLTQAAEADLTGLPVRSFGQHVETTGQLLKRLGTSPALLAGSDTAREALAEITRVLAESQTLARLDAAYGYVGTRRQTAAAMPGDIGTTAYHAYGRRPSANTRLRGLLGVPVVAPVASATGATLPCAIEQPVRLGRRAVRQVNEAVRSLGAVALSATIEERLPSAVRATDPAQVIGRARALAELEQRLASVRSSEVSYAASLGSEQPAGARASSRRRAPLQDVAAHAAWARARQHADPFTVYRDTVVAMGGQGHTAVARAIELGVMQRVDGLLFDRVTVESRAGERTERRPLGWDLDERHRAALERARETQTLPQLVQWYASRLGPQDTEFKRINRVATRLMEADLALHAVATLRPAAAGQVDPAAPLPSWPATLLPIARHAFREQADPQWPTPAAGRPPMTWAELLLRHPDAAQAGAPARSTLEPSMLGHGSAVVDTLISDGFRLPRVAAAPVAAPTVPPAGVRSTTARPGVAAGQP